MLPSKEYDNTLLYGLRAIKEAVLSGKEFDRVFVQKGLKSDIFGELRRLLEDHKIPYQFVPAEKLNRVTNNRNHQGIVAFISHILYHRVEDVLPGIFEDGKTPLILVLDRITDVRNFGAICRTAECAGVQAVVIPAHGAAQVNGDAMKASAGALHSIPVCREPNLKAAIAYLKESGLKIVSVTEKASEYYPAADYSGPTAFLLGSEEDGISPEYIKNSDARVKIPMNGKIESLNVSVAAGIVLFEAVKQRTGK
ncbi:MAG TPA: 23S rRNA (guanosine(2251)-2'-O)-methyltransferase RlmB [Bacteroidia bacterium]|jgi:23S rRNA (guanosine2251-2'-O)-methyltransferase|nr:23S rRNA (guanosine(2251)-2'-O)-methyltransferase RlmB [Bacteroidia bacterium]